MDFEKGFDVSAYEEEWEDKEPENKEKAKTREIFDWVDTVVVALISVVIIFSFFFRMATIVGPSMQNTLYEGDRIILSNFFYKAQYGDIVVISRNTDNSVDTVETSREPIIKRVIATGGQYVDIDFESGKVYVGADPGNMVELEEYYIKEPTHLSYDVEFPIYVKEGYVFVLGDNRNNSIDSRSTSIGEGGLIDERYILGKAVCRVWPLDSIGGLSYDE